MLPTSVGWLNKARPRGIGIHATKIKPTTWNWRHFYLAKYRCSYFFLHLRLACKWGGDDESCNEMTSHRSCFMNNSCSKRVNTLKSKHTNVIVMTVTSWITVQWRHIVCYIHLNGSLVKSDQQQTRLEWCTDCWLCDTVIKRYPSSFIKLFISQIQ